MSACVTWPSPSVRHDMSSRNLISQHSAGSGFPQQQRGLEELPSFPPPPAPSSPLPWPVLLFLEPGCQPARRNDPTQTHRDVGGGYLKPCSFPCSSPAACEHRGECSKLQQGEGDGARQEYLAQKIMEKVRFRVALGEPTVPASCPAEGTSAFGILTPG